MAKIMVIQGPNINMLGKRNQSIYGIMTMSDIHKQMQIVADQANVEIEFFQSNFEGEIIDKIQECAGICDGIIINPAAFTHTSVAIADAIEAVNLPVIEVHITNIYAREEFRHKSFITKVSSGSIVGFGPLGYHLAMIAMLQRFEQIKQVKNAQNE